MKKHSQSKVHKGFKYIQLTFPINIIMEATMKYPVQNGKEVIFQNMERQNSFSLRNQETQLHNVRETDIEDYLDDMFITPDQFVVLAAPAAQNNIRFVQATVHKSGDLEVELGIEGEGTKLYYKFCSEKECCQIFLDFYNNHFNPDLREYKPVEFMQY